MVVGSWESTFLLEKAMFSDRVIHRPEIGAWYLKSFPTVDGRNPAPADMVNMPLFTGFICHVVQDLFHQQYDLKNFEWGPGRSV